MTPKQQFILDNLRVTQHNEMVASGLFRVSSQTALLQMQENLLGTGASGEKALSNYHMMAGARIFLQILSGLGRTDTPAQKAELPDNLRHEITNR